MLVLGLSKYITYEGGDDVWKEGEVKSGYFGPYEILQRVGKVAYELALPAELASFHQVFHVSM